MALAEYLGVHPRFTDSTMTGGSSFEVHVEHAAAAIAAGLADVVMSVYASTPRGDRARAGGTAARAGRRPPIDGGPNPQAEWEVPSGIRMPMGAYALAATRHMALYGTTPEQLAQIAVSTREWATMNPKARYQDPITIDDVLSSPMQTSPLHLLDCCLVTDGAGAFVMTSAERAKRPGQAPRLRARGGHLPRPRHDLPDARPRRRPRERSQARPRSAWPGSSRATSTCSWATTASPSPPSCT